MASYIRLHTDVTDGVRKISSFDTNGEVLKQNDLNIILHALSIPEQQTNDVFAYDFGMSF